MHLPSRIARCRPTRPPKDRGPQVRGNLPSRVPRLYGREEDLAAIAALLREHPVVTITGPGGIGKTRVAQAVAKRIATDRAADYPDGVWWVELGALADGALVPSAVAQAMAVRVAGDRPTAQVLRAQLASQRALLVFDNCEHLANSVAALVDTVTAGAARVSILVTSQETLRAADEHVYRLGPLAVPAAADTKTALQSGAVELFQARAQAVDPRFTLDRGQSAGRDRDLSAPGRHSARDRARRRAPAAAWRRGIARAPPRALQRPDRRGTRGSAPPSDIACDAGMEPRPPHRDEQTVFRRLAVFAGGFTLEAAQRSRATRASTPGSRSITSARWWTSRWCWPKVIRSRVTGCWRHTRAYGLERLADAGETQATLRRHAEAVLALLESFETDDWQWRATGSTVPAARVELDNLRAALDWADTAADGRELVVALAGVSYCVWWSSAHMAEGLARCLALHRHVDPSVPTQAAARFWYAIGNLGLYSFRRESYDAATRAAALYREQGDDQRCFDALVSAAAQGARFATVAEMEAAITEATRLERPSGPLALRASLQFARCWWLARQGLVEEALDCARLQVAVCRDGGAEIASLYAVSNVTIMEMLLGRWHEALEHARTAIARLHALAGDAGAGHLYQTEMVALLMLGRMDEAWVAARNAYARLLQEGDEYRMLLSLALLNALQGRLDVAARIVGFDDAVQARIGEAVNVLAPIFRARLGPLLAAGLPDDERTRLAAEGAALRDDEAFRLAFGGSA